MTLQKVSAHLLDSANDISGTTGVFPFRLLLFPTSCIRLQLRLLNAHKKLLLIEAEVVQM